MKAFSIILLLLLIASLSGLIHIGIVHASSSTLLHVNHGASSPFQNYISDSSGNLVHLTGINYGDIPSGDPRYSNALSPSAAAANIKADGFNAVRLVVEWGAVETGTSSTFSYNLDSSSTFYARLQALTGSPNHLYVIIKLHADSDSSTNSAWGTNLARILGSAYCNPSTGTYYSTKMADSFYNTAYTSQYSAQQHFQQLWNQIASITSNNQYVVGYDFLNEPTRPYSYNNSLGTCTNSNQYSESDAQIRSEWHARINDLIANLRCSGVNTSTCSNLADNRMYFIEEAPFFSYYGGSGSLTFTPYTDTTLGYDNTISSVHFYRDEYPYYPNSGSYIACSSNPSDLASFWGNTATSSNNGPPSCTTAGASTVPLWAGVAQSSFPNQAFDVGEYGNIFDTNTTAPGVNDNQGVINQYGTSNYDWIVKSTNMFTFTQGTVGNTYYAQGSDVYPPANPNWQTILAHSPDLIPYATQGSINLAPGASTSVPALITGIDGFSGTVSFSATSSYSGITTTFTSNSMTISSPGGTASNSLSITVSSSTPTG
jgi:hypothetical protein